MTLHWKDQRRSVWSQAPSDCGAGQAQLCIAPWTEHMESQKAVFERGARYVPLAKLHASAHPPWAEVFYQDVGSVCQAAHHLPPLLLVQVYRHAPPVAALQRGRGTAGAAKQSPLCSLPTPQQLRGYNNRHTARHVQLNAYQQTGTAGRHNSRSCATTGRCPAGPACAGAAERRRAPAALPAS